MRMFTKKEKDILLLAAKVEGQKGDAELLLLQKLHDLEDEIHAAIKITKGEKGDKGERGEMGPRGITITGPKGERGLAGQTVVGPAGADGKDGKDGETPSKDELVAIIEPLIPKVENGKDAVVDEEAIVAKVLKRIPRPTGRLGGGAAPHPMKFYDLSSQTNASKKIFSVPKSVNAVVFTSDFPYILIEGNGFTMDKSRTQLTLTVDNAPSTGAQLLLQYSALFNTTT